MLWTPQKGRLRIESVLGTTGSPSFGFTVPHAATSSAKGTPTQLLASTAFDVCWVTVIATTNSTTGTQARGCLDILTGAATEDILIPNLLTGYAGLTGGANLGGPIRWDFPLHIPAGTRIAAQAAGERVSPNGVSVSICLYGGLISPPWRVGTRVTTYGVTPPTGVSITPGNAAQGAWTQIAAASAADHFAFVPSFQLDTTNILGRALTMDIGIGAATEEEILSNHYGASTTVERLSAWATTFPAFKDVPSGTRLVARMSCSGSLDAYEAAIHAVNS